MNEIDKIKLDVINNKFKYNELLELYIKYLKLCLLEKNKLASYNKDFKYYVNDRRTNCYAYAFRLDMPEYFDKQFISLLGHYFYFNVGCFSGNDLPETKDGLLECLYADLDILGIDYKEGKCDTDHTYNVAVFKEDVDIRPDFHFSRQNTNMMWSCKNGYTRRVDKSNKPISLGYKLVKVLNINR